MEYKHTKCVRMVKIYKETGTFTGVGYKLVLIRKTLFNMQGEATKLFIPWTSTARNLFYRNNQICKQTYIQKKVS